MTSDYTEKFDRDYFPELILTFHHILLFLFICPLRYPSSYFPVIIRSLEQGCFILLSLSLLGASWAFSKCCFPFDVRPSHGDR